MGINKNIVRGSISVIYLLIGLEIIIMISPFAVYFYSVYGPLLNFLYDYKATAWLSGFFLPHAVVSKSVILNFLGSFGRILFSLGIIGFFVCAFQIYSAKFRHKGMVGNILYRWIRHPQYLFLALAGFGLLLFWPRFIILVLYTSMLLIYYLLARYEEQQMLAKYGDSYQTYMHRTAMFLVGEPGGKIFRALLGRIKSRATAVAISFGVVLVVVIGVAFGLRSYTISQTSIVYSPEKKVTAISISPRSDQFLLNALDAVYRDRAVVDTLKDFQRQGHQGFLVHVMPRHYRMQGLFIQPSSAEKRPFGKFLGRVVIRFLFPFLRSHGHHQMAGSMGNGPLRLIFSQLTWPSGQYAQVDQALNFNVKHLPLLKVDVDKTNKKVISFEKTQKRNFWGQMPMPLF